MENEITPDSKPLKAKSFSVTFALAASGSGGGEAGLKLAPLPISFKVSGKQSPSATQELTFQFGEEIKEPKDEQGDADK